MTWALTCVNSLSFELLEMSSNSFPGREIVLELVYEN
jgi:hypothetical protein